MSRKRMLINSTSLTSIIILQRLPRVTHVQDWGQCILYKDAMGNSWRKSRCSLWPNWLRPSVSSKTKILGLPPMLQIQDSVLSPTVLAHYFCDSWYKLTIILSKINLPLLGQPSLFPSPSKTSPHHYKVISGFYWGIFSWEITHQEGINSSNMAAQSSIYMLFHCGFSVQEHCRNTLVVQGRSSRSNAYPPYEWWWSPTHKWSQVLNLCHSSHSLGE